MTTYDARPSGFTQLTTTSDWESFMSTAGIQDGIDPVNGGAFVPSLDTGGRNAVVSAGQALIKGQLWRADAPVSTPIPAASAQNRYDVLVLRLNRGATTSPTVVQPVVITGTPSGTPQLPPITQTPTGLWDIPVSNWLSNSSGTLTNLVDARQFAGRGIQTEQFDTGSYTITGTSFQQATKLWNIPASDPAPNTAYRLRAWGGGNWGSPTTALNLRGNFTGAGGLGQLNWGATYFVASTAFTWYVESTIIITVPGATGSYISFTRMDLSASSGNLLGTNNSAQSTSAGARTGSGSGVLNTTAPMQMWLDIDWNTGGTGNSINCTGSSFQRIGG